MDLHFVPLVVVGGLGGEPSEQSTPLPLTAVDFGPEVQRNVALDSVQAELSARSQQSAPWIEPAKQGSPALRIQFTSRAHIYTKRDRPSILSPKHPESKLHPDGLFTVEWVRKYSEFWPSTAVVVFDIDPQANLTATAAHINKMKTQLTKLEVRLVAVITSQASLPSADLETAVAELRRSTGLAPRTGMLMLPPDATQVEISVFVETLWQLLGANTADFFASRAREVRHKRDNLASGTTEALRYDARYTLKLAVFSEFKYDVRGALRLYESSYDCVRQLFDNGLGPDSAMAWCSARELADIIALKIATQALYLKDPAMANKKYRYHLRSVRHLLKANEIGSSPAWLANAYYRLALLLERSTLSPPPQALYDPMPQQPAGLANALPRAGMLYLDAARAALEPANDKDPYTPNAFDMQTALNAAYADLKAFPHTAGGCLQLHADYLLAQGDKSGALSKLEQALPLLLSSWPHKAVVARQILQLSSDPVQKATAQLALLATGDAKVDLGSDQATKLGRVETELFEVEGTFQGVSGFLGRKVKSQITLQPKFEGTLQLATIKIIYTGSSVSLEHNDGVDATRDVYSEEANLVFSGGKPKTFEISMSVAEPGNLAIESVHIFGASPVFLQECKVRSAHIWRQHPVSPVTTRHLQLANPREIEVLSRQPQITFRFETAGRVAPLEKAACFLTISNNEDEVSHVDLQVYVDEDGVGEQQVFGSKFEVPAHGASDHPFVYEAPLQGSFTLRAMATYTTDTDPLPVKASDTIAVDIANVLRTTFDLVPVIHLDPWPNQFVPVSHKDVTPLIPRAWQLQVVILPLTDETVLHDVKVDFDSEDAIIELMEPEEFKSQRLQHNEPTRTKFDFVSRRRTRDLRSFDGRATVRIKWSRNSSLDVLNELVLPPLRLSLTHQEPRVLCVAETGDQDLVVKLDYFVENSTAHILTFAVSMGTSPDFSIQGPKGGSLRVLPFSRRKLHYELVVLKDQRSPLPDLRVFDTTYKRALTVLCGNSSIVKGANGMHLNI